jgi:hypothetical protein
MDKDEIQDLINLSIAKTSKKLKEGAIGFVVLIFGILSLLVIVIQKKL